MVLWVHGPRFGVWQKLKDMEPSRIAPMNGCVPLLHLGLDGDSLHQILVVRICLPLQFPLGSGVQPNAEFTRSKIVITACAPAQEIIEAMLALSASLMAWHGNQVAGVSVDGAKVAPAIEQSPSTEIKVGFLPCEDVFLPFLQF